MIPNNLERIRNELGKDTRLVVVTKTRSLDEIRQVYDAGHRLMGENRVQELLSKYEQLPADIEWHLIGHLQTNKVKYIAPFIALIHSVDSLKLAQEIDRQAAKLKRTIPVLLQVYVASEETKFGLDEDELYALLDDPAFRQLQHIEVAGLMGMASNTDNTSLVHSEFTRLKNIFDKVKQQWYKDNPAFRELSMGMSGDYRLATEHGSTLVRIGSAVFS